MYNVPIMTKYVLNSGGFRNRGDEGCAFYAEMIKDLGDRPKVLVCSFADIRERWDRNFYVFTTHMSERVPGGVNPIFERVDEYRFEEQVQEAELIYFYGGDVEVVKNNLAKYNVDTLFSGKVVAGSSAGAAVWATYYWSGERRKALPGLNVLPMKFIPHYKANSIDEYDAREPVDWDKGYMELEEIGDSSQQIHAMKEGDYVVVREE